MYSNTAAYKNFESNEEFFNVVLAPAPVIGILLNGLTGEAKKKAIVEFIEKKLKSEKVHCVANKFELTHTMMIKIKTQDPEIIYTLGNVNSMVEMLHFDPAETIRAFDTAISTETFTTVQMLSFPLFISINKGLIVSTKNVEKKADKNSGLEPRNNKEKGSEQPGNESTKESNKSTANHQNQPHVDKTSITEPTDQELFSNTVSTEETIDNQNGLQMDNEEEPEKEPFENQVPKEKIITEDTIDKQNDKQITKTHEEAEKKKNESQSLTQNHDLQVTQNQNQPPIEDQELFSNTVSTEDMNINIEITIDNQNGLQMDYEEEPEREAIENQVPKEKVITEDTIENRNGLQMNDGEISKEPAQQDTIDKQITKTHEDVEKKKNETQWLPENPDLQCTQNHVHLEVECATSPSVQAQEIQIPSPSENEHPSVHIEPSKSFQVVQIENEIVPPIPNNVDEPQEASTTSSVSKKRRRRSANIESPASKKSKMDHHITLYESVKLNKRGKKVLDSGAASNLEANIEKAHRWTVYRLIRTGYNLYKKENDIDDEKKQKLDELFSMQEEEFNMNYESIPVDFNFPVPFDNNFRGLREYLRSNTIRLEEYDEANDSQEPGVLKKLRACGALHINLDTTARDALELAKQWIEDGKNRVFSQKPIDVITPDPNLLEEERRVFKVPKDKWQFPAPEYYPQSSDDLLSDEFEKMAEQLSVLMVRNFIGVMNIDTSAFNIENLAEGSERIRVDCRDQISQSPLSNFDESGEEKFEVPSRKSRIASLKSYSKHRTSLLEKCRKLFERILNSNDFARAVDDIVREEFRLSNGKGDPKCPISIFATNFDLDKRKFEKPVENFDSQLPALFQVENKKNLLSESNMHQKLPGMNKMQLYMKAPGARTPFHTENSHMASVNINLGDEECLWVITQPEYNDKIGTLIENHWKEEEVRHNQFTQNFWLTVEELRAAQIPYMIVEQRPGDLIYINRGTGHWVASTGFCHHISWNVGPTSFSQLSAAMVVHDRAIEKTHGSVYPLFFSAWKYAEFKYAQHDEEFVKRVRSLLYRCLVYNQMCLDLYQKEGLEEWKDINRQTRKGANHCKKCGTEVFNVFVVYLEGNEFFQLCEECRRQAKGVKLNYIVRKQLSMLSKILDNYHFVPSSTN